MASGIVPSQSRLLTAPPVAEVQHPRGHVLREPLHPLPAADKRGRDHGGRLARAAPADRGADAGRRGRVVRASLFASLARLHNSEVLAPRCLESRFCK